MAHEFQVLDSWAFAFLECFQSFHFVAVFVEWNSLKGQIMAVKQGSFRVGKVRGDLRGLVWYLTYFEEGRRRRPRVGPDKNVARQMAAQINSQLEVGAPAALSFAAVSLDELQASWLRHHEQVLRSSVQTINRYRTATKHLLDFVDKTRVPRTTSHFRAQHAEEFVRYLRTIEVSPNGHPHSKKRPLLDKGIKFILETCRALFNFAMKRRHLSPYAENPFSVIDLDRIPIENHRSIVIFSADEERQFFQQCDDWQFPIFATLLMTGMRPGELCHLLLPEDVDLTHDLLMIRNKPKLGWQVKTRCERVIPIMPVLRELLRQVVGKRQAGPLFLRRRFVSGVRPTIGEAGSARLERELADRIARQEVELQRTLTRQERLVLARHLWTDAGAVKPDLLRSEFLRITREIGQSHQTAPKVFRHLFATSLQDANVDPLIRCELLGHSTGASSASGNGLGMTANYTHTRLETKRKQLQAALEVRPVVELALHWCDRKKSTAAESISEEPTTSNVHRDADNVDQKSLQTEPPCVS